MAIGVGHFQQQQSQMLAFAGQALKNHERVTDSSPCRVSSQPGTMYVNDYFDPANLAEAGDLAQNPHGIQVARAARQQSFQGRIEGASQHTSPHHARMDQGLGQLRTQPLQQREARQAVQDIVGGRASGLLDAQGQYLDGLTQRGARNSSANISMGTSKAAITRDMYAEASMAWMPGRQAMPPNMRAEVDQNLRNLATAYNLDTAKLTHPDPQVHRAERQRLQQRLLDHVGQTMDRDPTVAQEKRQWAESVSRFEAGNNSVVISAGNEGADLEQLQRGNGNRPLRAPADASTNILENSQVTSVGATRWFNTANGPQERRANYSSDSQGVDIYAAGSLDANGGSRADMHGTSFASPRVAAMMAELHRRHPNASSSEIEAMMKEQYTHQLSSGGQTLPVLDFQRSSQFLAHSPTRH